MKTKEIIKRLRMQAKTGFNVSNNYQFLNLIADLIEQLDTSNDKLTALAIHTDSTLIEVIQELKAENKKLKEKHEIQKHNNIILCNRNMELSVNTVELENEIAELKANLNKAIGMVELAVNDIPHICETCGIENRVNPDCWCNQRLNPNTYIHSAWEWQHQAKLDEMKGELRNERD